MINEVILEGIVVRDPWKFMDDLFFRLVTYRDRDLPAKKLDLEHDAGDYTNWRIIGGANGLIQVRRGMRLRVHGYLQSRDFRESLEEFINKARKTKTMADLTVEAKAAELVREGGPARLNLPLPLPYGYGVRVTLVKTWYLTLVAVVCITGTQQTV